MAVTNCQLTNQRTHELPLPLPLYQCLLPLPRVCPYGRYTEWVAWDSAALAPIWTNVTAHELYDHRGEVPYPTDMDVGETANVASNRSYTAICSNLSSLLRAQFGR